ncbi:hypothetical protein Nepgr_024793 [Nepenthes gracilis]|uniref:Uncharacterized protein n=1 Tax=Nepenthes gracilis TaxID=150966 RepID=A0AAD3Y0F1_NEPGR|nr:hypothetical protein Nepgr_024793 [Nepenthes gracilis]
MHAGSSVSKDIESYEAQAGVCTKPSRLRSTQLSFTSRECLSQISLVNECVIDGSFTSEKGHKRRSHSQSATNFSISPWDDGNSIVFSAPPSKRPCNNNDSILDDISAMESQVENHPKENEKRDEKGFV